jgi:uncharacterized protein YndB with AHSA1/START domain
MTAHEAERRLPLGGKIPRNALGWFRALAREKPGHYHLSDRASAHPLAWPAGFDPRANPVYARNSLDIAAPPTAVFAVLVDATRWPSFYPNADAVVIEQGRETTLRAGSRFTWRTFATPQESQVVLFEPNVSLGWTAKSPGTRALHRWVLEPTAQGTHLITEECQVGIIASLDRYWMNRSLRVTHQIWLERMRDHLLETSKESAR